jgi:hypothetical protein
MYAKFKHSPLLDGCDSSLHSHTYPLPLAQSIAAKVECDHRSGFCPSDRNYQSISGNYSHPSLPACAGLAEALLEACKSMEGIAVPQSDLQASVQVLLQRGSVFGEAFLDRHRRLSAVDQRGTHSEVAESRSVID